MTDDRFSINIHELAGCYTVCKGFISREIGIFIWFGLLECY